jgi:SET domain-containing protein
MTPIVKIMPSPIAGVGVFATQDIPRNTKLGDYKGVEMTLAEFKEQYGGDISYTYSLRFVNKILVGKDEPYRSQNISHYMNEGEQNCLLKKRGVYTTRDIKKGEELFLTYPKRYIRTWL